MRVAIAAIFVISILCSACHAQSDYPVKTPTVGKVVELSEGCKQLFVEGTQIYLASSGRRRDDIEFASSVGETAYQRIEAVKLALGMEKVHGNHNQRNSSAIGLLILYINAEIKELSGTLNILYQALGASTDTTASDYLKRAKDLYQETIALFQLINTELAIHVTKVK